MIKRRCDSCGKQYEAQRASSKFCSPTCRVRASRGATAATVTQIRSSRRTSTTTAPEEPRPPAAYVNGISVAMKDALEKAERLDTVLGQAALTLALRIDAGRDTGSAVASLTKEMRATFELAMRGVDTGDSPLDELLKRRIARLGA